MGLFGGGSSAAADQASQAAQQASQNQTNIDNQLLQLVNQLANRNTQYYQNLLPGTSSDLSQLVGGAGAQAGGAGNLFMALAQNPQLMSAITGINAPGLVGEATGYLSNPGQTLLSKVVPGALGAAGAPLSFFNNEMQGGLDPRYELNAQNQLQQNFGQSMSDILAHLAPGQNPAAALQAGQNQLLTSSTNLGAQLAGESQQFANQGAQSFMSALPMLAQMAGGLDEQTMKMLTEAASMGMGYNQGQLQNTQNAATFGQDTLSRIMQFLNQGNAMQGGAMSSLGGLGQQAGQQAEYYSQQAQQAAAAAQQQQNGLWSSLIGLGANYLLPGSGALFGGLGGGGGGGFNWSAMLQPNVTYAT